MNLSGILVSCIFVFYSSTGKYCCDSVPTHQHVNIMLPFIILDCVDNEQADLESPKSTGHNLLLKRSIVR